MAGSSEARLGAIWTGSWEPPDRRPPWAWAEEHVRSIPYSPIPARFRSDNSPWVREPLEALVDVRVKKVQIVAGIQASKTLLMELGSAYIIKNMPGPLLWLDQKDDEGKDELENRLMPLWQHTPAVAALLPGRTGASRHKAKRDVVTFANAMTAWVKGANNLKNLQRRSIRWLFGDETWSWPAGHAAEAEARVTAFGWLGKIFFSSQAGEEGDDTDVAFQAGDQREWCYTCLDCKKFQPFVWETAQWGEDAKRDDGTWAYAKVRESARIECAECGSPHDTNQDRIRRMMSDPKRGAGYKRMNPEAPDYLRSYHWNGMCSTPIGDLAERYLRAKAEAKKGELDSLKIFYQKRLALPWRDEFEDFKMEIDVSTYRRGEEWFEECVINRFGKIVPRPHPPATEDDGEDEEWSSYRAEIRGAARGRIMYVDCQMDHFWAVVRSFNERGDSRLMDWRGGREGDRSLLTWEDLDALAAEYGVTPRLVMVDAGDNTSRVYQECAKRGWTAMMGDRRATFTHFVTSEDGKQKLRVERFYSPVRKVNLGQGMTARVHYFSNLNAKDILARLRRNQDPEEGTTWEVYGEVEDEYLRQMDSERRVKGVGNKKTAWSQVGKRPNHLWDCEVGCIVALLMLKLVGKEAIPEPAEDGEGEEGSA